jgi:hypothetical protein
MIASGGRIEEEHLPFTIVSGIFGLYAFVVFLMEGVVRASIPAAHV